MIGWGKPRKWATETLGSAAPAGAFIVCNRFPTADAVGYFLALLRSFRSLEKLGCVFER
jgi:hypothetical protein